MRRLPRQHFVAILVVSLAALMATHAPGLVAQAETPAVESSRDPAEALFADRDLFVPDELIVAFRPAERAAAGTDPSETPASDGSASADLDPLLAEVGAIAVEAVYPTRARVAQGAGVSATEAAAPAAAQSSSGSGGAGTTVSPQVDVAPLLVRLAPGSSVLAAVARLAAHPDVLYAEPNYRVGLHGVPLPSFPYVPDDRYLSADGLNWSQGAWGQDFLDLWGVEDIEAVAAWNDFDSNGSGRFDPGELRPGEGVVVAVIDTGLDRDHPDIALNVWRNPGELPDNGLDDDGNGFIDDVSGWDFVDGDNDPDDLNGHGTHVSGTIAATADNGIGIVGVAPFARIVPVKGFGVDGSGSVVDLSRAVRYAADLGADILSNSWGSPISSQLLASAFAYAQAQGALAIASAGNDDGDIQGVVPAGLESVIAVAALEPDRSRASFSNFGRGVDLSAPGVGVLSLNASAGESRLAMLFPERVVDGDYLFLQGTSMACPHVAGVAAVLLGLRPEESAQEIRGRLRAGARSIDAENPGFEGLLGSGRVQLFDSLVAEPRPLLEMVGTDVDSLRPGAVSNVVVRLRNFWAAATGVVAELSTASPLASVRNGRVALGDIGPGETLANDAAPFVVEVTPAAVYGDRIPVELLVTDDSGSSQTLRFSLAIHFFQDATARSGLPIFDLVPWRVNLEDYDGDGLTDAHWVGFARNALYKNLGDGRFADASAGSGVITPQPVGTMQGLLFDIDNDRDRDLFLGGINLISTSRFFLNGGLGRFSDISSTSGLEGFRAFSSVAFDYDDDGFVDIAGGAGRHGPATQRPEGFFLARNTGAGSFEETTLAACVDTPLDLTNGQLVAFDYDDDGDLDLLGVGLEADLTLLRHNADGRFSDVTHDAGLDFQKKSDVACRRHGRFGRGTRCPRDSAMGLAIGDYDNDGDLDVFVTGRGRRGDPQRNALFRNDGDGAFTDVIDDAGDLALGGLGGLHWGNAFFDYDNDGDLDLHVTNAGEDAAASNSLYRNDGDGRFSLVTDLAFPQGTAPSGAAAAMGDVDDDGALDIYAPSGLLGQGGSGALYLNLVGATGHWLAVDLQGTLSDAEAFGARVTVTAGGRSLIREVHTGPVETLPLHFGLGDATTVDEIRIRWPSGLVETHPGTEVDRRVSFVEASTCLPSDPVNPTCLAAAEILARRALAAGVEEGGVPERCEVQGRPAELDAPASDAQGPKPKKLPPGQDK